VPSSSAICAGLSPLLLRDHIVACLGARENAIKRQHKYIDQDLRLATGAVTSLHTSVADQRST
jgi:hypothetical protein